MITAVDVRDARPTGPGVPCWWCDEPIPAESPETGRKTREDAQTCSRRCRQASSRFGSRGPARRVGSTRSLRLAYADPPYPGMSGYYDEHPDFAGEVDHEQLVDQLLDEFDGWALSTSSKTLFYVASLLQARGLRWWEDYRPGVWTKPAPPGRARLPRCSWEPVIFVGGRWRPDDAPMVLDWVHAAPPREFPGQVTGTKPAEFCFWLFDMLGAQPGDELFDLFPGSGAAARAWERYVGCPPPSAAARQRARRTVPPGGLLAATRRGELEQPIGDEDLDDGSGLEERRVA